MKENINDIRKCLEIIQKSFDEAEKCTSCEESCCDVYGNLVKRIYKSLNNIEQYYYTSSNEISINEVSSPYKYFSDDSWYNPYSCYEEECEPCECPEDCCDTCECIVDCTECVVDCTECVVDCTECTRAKIFLTSFDEQTIESYLPIAFENTPVQNDNLEVFELINQTTIVLKEEGFYSFEYFAMPKTANKTLALYLNNTELSLTRYTNRAASEKIIGRGIFYNNTPNSELKIVNIDNNDLKLEKGIIESTVLAYLYITQL